MRLEKRRTEHYSIDIYTLPDMIFVINYVGRLASRYSSLKCQVILIQMLSDSSMFVGLIELCVIVILRSAVVKHMLTSVFSRDECLMPLVEALLKHMVRICLLLRLQSLEVTLNKAIGSYGRIVNLQ